MTELERRALLGDREAQRECTEKGIALPCPFCDVSLVESEEEGWLKHPYSISCVFSDIEISEKTRLSDWNTRPAPPIGRCGTCKHSRSQEIYCELGCLLALKPDDYCSYYEPREEK